MKVRLMSVSVPVFDEAIDELSTVEWAARTCHKSTGKLGTNPKFIPLLIKSGHMSILEHSSVSIEVVGMSRAASLQLVRHRLCSFSQESQRHVDPTVAGMEFVTPPRVEACEAAVVAYAEIMDKIEGAYRALVSLGIPKEDARFVLPNACATSLVVSGNWRVWIELLQKRLDAPAQWEIKELAQKVFKILGARYPSVFNKETMENVTKYNLDYGTDKSG